MICTYDVDVDISTYDDSPGPSLAGSLGKTMCTTMIGFMTLSPTTGGQATVRIILTEIMRKRSWEARWGFTIGGQKLETDATGRNILDPTTIII